MAGLHSFRSFRNYAAQQTSWLAQYSYFPPISLRNEFIRCLQILFYGVSDILQRLLLGTVLGSAAWKNRYPDAESLVGLQQTNCIACWRHYLLLLSTTVILSNLLGWLTGGPCQF